MEMSNQPFAACTEIDAIGDGAGEGTLGSTPARWLVAFTAETIRVSVSYKYGSRSLSGASWATVSMISKIQPTKRNYLLGKYASWQSPELICPKFKTRLHVHRYTENCCESAPFCWQSLAQSPH